MDYSKTIILKDGGTCVLRKGTEQDGHALLDIFNRTHSQTDYLRTYPDESAMTVDHRECCRFTDARCFVPMHTCIDNAIPYQITQAS
jgi:hypothetical protein